MKRIRRRVADLMAKGGSLWVQSLLSVLLLVLLTLLLLLLLLLPLLLLLMTALFERASWQRPQRGSPGQTPFCICGTPSFMRY